ncbi:hypothetical protein [Salidesulfovibrio brasiliensis]|uniref:hypothetical protein n=1 Tax=Salidesulfovibrio brasiliensis TaxID=221711 RepID=UPI0006D07FB0|nr:hypothetical protein [Salidesulfovibrio brasiliensis]
MAKLIYAVPCHDVIVDRQSSDTTFIRSIEHASPTELPATLPGFFIGTLWEPQSPDPFSVSLQLKTPGGETVLLGSQEVQPGESMLHKMTFQLPGLEVKEEGRHGLQVCILEGGQWKPLTDLPLFIVKR